MSNIVIVEQMDTAGAVVWWSLEGGCSHAKLGSCLAQEGIKVQLPDLPSAEVALRRAVTEQRTKRTLVRPLKGKKGWAIVDETEHDDDLHYNVDLHVSLDRVGRLKFEPAGEFEAFELPIREAFNRYFDQLTADDVSAWLVQTAEHFGAIRLKPNGGLYFIPRGQVPAWRAITIALETASGHKCYSVPAMRTSDVIDAVHDAISSDVDAYVADLESSIADADLGKIALENRARVCTDMLKRVHMYEESLQVKLSSLTDKVQEMQLSISAAILSATAEEQEKS